MAYKIMNVQVTVKIYPLMILVLGYSICVDCLVWRTPPFRLRGGPLLDLNDFMTGSYPFNSHPPYPLSITYSKYWDSGQCVIYDVE